MNLLSACIKAEACQGGTLSQFLPFVSSEMKILGKVYSGDGTSHKYEKEITILYKGLEICHFNTLANISLKTLDLMSLPDTTVWN